MVDLAGFLNATGQGSESTFASSPVPEACTVPSQCFGKGYNPMENTENMKNFLSQVDSIQSRFLESLITGKRNSIFKEETTPSPESEDEARQVYIDSQRGTF
jgi:hypothetical protein